MITAQPDWNDVVRRAAQRRRRSLTVRAAAVAALTLVVAAPAFGLGVGGWLHAHEPGRAVPPSKLRELDLGQTSGFPRGRFVITGVRLVAHADSESFYVFDLASGRRCYGAGATGASTLFSVAACPPAGGFPSASEPLLDLSTRADGRRIVVAGVAADGISAVGITDARGRVIARVRVSDNVFALSRVPRGATGPLVVFDAAGRRVNGARTVAPAACTVKVYFGADADAQEISYGIAVAHTTPHVRTVSFVSRAAALAAMEKQYPALTKNLTSNPLPSSLTIVPDSPSAVQGIVAHLRSEHVGGVVMIRSRC